MTLVVTIDGETFRRAYSIHTAPHEGRIAVCVKPSEIVVEGSRGASPVNVSLKSPDETSMPAIKRVGTN